MSFRHEALLAFVIMHFLLSDEWCSVPLWRRDLLPVHRTFLVVEESRCLFSANQIRSRDRFANSSVIAISPILRNSALRWEASL